MTLPTFYYANGTAVAANFFGFEVGPIGGGSDFHVEGVNGEFYSWDGAVATDPFPQMLDTSLWQWKRVPYPASALDIGTSIKQGVDWTIAEILDTPGPFALGGYSQGAAVMSNVYNECRQGRLVDRRQDLRAIVNFGNPMREKGKTFKGSSGYAGAFDIAGSTTGSHGCFPVRLQNTEDFVYEFTMPNEVITGVGDSNAGKLFVSAAGKLLSNDLAGALLDVMAATEGSALSLINLATSLLNGIASFVGVPAANLLPLGQTVASLVGAAAGTVSVVDPYTNGTISLSGGGHVRYPFDPPPNSDGSDGSGDTCYQIAVKYLNQVGAQIYAQANPTIPVPTTPVTYSWFSSLPV